MKNLLRSLIVAMAVGGAVMPANVVGQAISSNGGSIQGTISDPTGAAIPNASIVITDPDTGYTHKLTTDSAGFYSLGPLNPGTYKVTIAAPSFSQEVLTTVIRTGTVTSGNAKLTLGSSTETIEVNAGALQINTDQIGVSGVVTQEEIDTLPINGRNILDVAQLQPGVILQSGQTFDPTKAGYSAISVSGVGGRTTRILFDGQDITDETVGTTIYNVPEGGVGELQLNRSTQDVSGETTSTGQVLLSSRSGTNSFHGNAFYNFQDNHAGFANVGGLPAPFQRNQFGGYVGGYIIKDKLFFFGGGERIKQHEDDVATGANPVFAATEKQYHYVPAPFNDTFSIARLDYNAPWNMHMFVRAVYSVNSDDATFGANPYQVYENRDNVPGLVGGVDMQKGRLTHSFRVGYEKFHNLLVDGTAALGNSIYNPSTGPNNQITLAGDMNAGPNFLAPQGTFQSDKQLRYDGTATFGAHSIKFGFDMNRLLGGGFAAFYGASLYTELSVANPVPCADVAGTSCPGDPVRGYSAEYYILGNGNGFFSERPGFGLAGGGVFSWRFGSYVGDTWKVKPYLTVTSGLRWSTDTDRANQDVPTPLCSTVDPSYLVTGCNGTQPLFNFYGSVGGTGGAYGAIGYKTHQPYANFSPQLGFVFSPGDHKTSVRGGIGLYYESDVFNNTGNARPGVITANGPYFGYAYVPAKSSSIALPGYGTISTAPDGTPISTITTESIYHAAPELNAIKAEYQAKVKGSLSANGSYVGTGNGLYANSLYAGPYKSPYSIQFNGGVQHEFARGIVLSVDYVHNATLKIPISVDVNSNGAARTLNTAAAKNAIAATLTACGVATIAQAIAACPGLHTDPTTGAVSGATITDFAGNGLDSGTNYLQNFSAAADGLTPATGAAFPGINPNVGTGLFILPVGRSGYDALQMLFQEQKAHPLPGIVTSNISIAYTLSRIVTGNKGTNAADQFFAGAGAWDNDDPNRYLGRSNLDHTNELSFGGTLGLKYGLQVGVVSHFYSAPPSTLTLDTLAGNTAQIFQTDVDGDGTIGDLAPGTNPGAYMHQVHHGNINKFIAQYNSVHANQLTPAGQALVSAGLLTQGQLLALGGVQQPIAPQAVDVPIDNAAFRYFDFNASYPIKFSKFHEGLSLVPGVVMYNVFNMSNFGAINGTLLNQADAGIAGYVNGPNNLATQNPLRINRNSGTFDQGGPRTTEFQLKLNF
ncbi:Carboxypeptidase regulatory-like domain-containing protein [Bryocella elongata]|uniref:Carboxypeptidase regulatory-like domain-containing protein n=1 Tax=Bryocella elongata TaxID=863522 RepID=A0A1H5Y0P1_9BACT|nr:carboxypeptidase regulatory-like domain-containing protein [Bryocella elongata]SEG17345.1 Carboxypeptidase regulatory-like domain-containing protein [Bryocella elongata]